MRVILCFTILCKKKELIFELDCALKKADDERKNLRNMKSLVFCFCAIYSLVPNTKMFLGPQNFF